MLESLYMPALAFAVTAVAILMLRPIAIRIGLTDKPDQRKQHRGEVPLVGGIAVFIGASVALAAGVLLSRAAAPPDALMAWFVAALLLLTVGICDDLYELTPVVRLAAEITAVLIMIYGGGTLLTDLGWMKPDASYLALGLFAVPFTVFAAVGVINAFNMCDGLDGLSGNLALVSLLAIGLADGLWGDASRVELTNVLSAAVAGFLLFNQRMIWRNKAMVFLGDAGTMMLGLTLAWGVIDLSQGSGRALSPAATLWVLMIPVFDTVRVMIRRVVHGGSPFRADARHLHHLLIRVGLTVGESIAIICLAASLGAAVGIILHGFGVPEFAIAVAFAVCGLCYYGLIERAWARGVFFGKKLAPP